MGLAASQARFLNLTARKTNIEYEGQQINQQRTTLSNQSANLYNQMLTLKVPTQPSIDSYTKLQYSFVPPDSVSTATVSSITKQKMEEGDDVQKYTIHYTVTEDVIGFYPCEKDKQVTVAKDESNNYTYSEGGGTFILEKLTDTEDPTHKDAYDYLCTGTEKKGDNLYYFNAGTEASPQYRYFTDTQMDAAIDDGKKCVYYTSTTQKQTSTSAIAKCTLSRDANNRLISFTDTEKDITYTVTAGTVTDQQAYDDAQNQYRYETFLYEQTLGKINAETSVLQAQDKTLELRLKQLDTEHQAVQTEVDSISEVIKKNIESSFKSFNA